MGLGVTELPGGWRICRNDKCVWATVPKHPTVSRSTVLTRMLNTKTITGTITRGDNHTPLPDESIEAILKEHPAVKEELLCNS
jgi:hypothetical protein